MKYIIMPILKFLLVAFQVVAWFFTGLLILPIWCLWEWSLKPVKQWIPDMGGPYETGYIPLFAKAGYRYYYYKTAWDWIIGRKSWDTLKEDQFVEEL